MLLTEREKVFLSELTELSKKYGIEVGGCGCCGSPTLYETEFDSRDMGGYGHVSGNMSDFEWIENLKEEK